MDKQKERRKALNEGLNVIVLGVKGAVDVLQRDHLELVIGCKD